MNQPPTPFADLSLAEKRMLLADLLRQKATFPLSHGQRGLWFLHHLDRAGAANNLFFPARIHARLNVPAFRRSLQTLIERHSSLRTTFEAGDGEPRQRVHNAPAGDSDWFEVHDAAAWSEEALRARVEDEAHRPFDLERGPLLRVRLFVRAPDNIVFLLAAHHLIGDFWSLVLLMEEMGQLYPAACAGTPLTLPPPTRHYRDFVRWQSEILASAEGECLAVYWDKQLSGVSPVLDVPTPRPHSSAHATASSRGAAEAFQLEPALTHRLKQLAAAEGVTPYTLLLAAFQVLLGRHSGQDDFVVGSPFAGRSRPEFERVVGYFVNLLPLRACLGENLSFRTLLQQTGATVMEALQHQDYPLALLVERLKLPRDPSRPPLVQVSFTLEKAHRPVGMGSWSIASGEHAVRLNVAGLPAEPYPLEHRTCPLDLEMILEEGEGTLHGMLRYNADRFDEASIRRMVGHYRTLLNSAINDPQSNIYDLPMLTEAEERQLLHEWNDTRVDYPADALLHSLFEQQAAKTPQAVALRCGERIIRYGELDAGADRLAERLRQRGIGPGDLVALGLERSPELIAAMLGVLKAGAAFVPLDPSSPPERLQGILRETDARVMLTELDATVATVGWVERSETHQDAELDATVGWVERSETHQDARWVERSETPPRKTTDHKVQRVVRSDDLAYVLYTSGSTGTPKGVMVEHRAICNTVLWHREKLTVRPDDRVLLLLSPVFDASLAVLFPALIAGAELVLAPLGEERDPARIVERIERDRVTILPIFGRLLRLLLSERFSEAGRSLRYIFCGGEPMPPDLPEHLFALLDVPLYNLYGPTETAIDATYWQCGRGDGLVRIPIGRPIDNVQVYVLDRQRRLLPLGVPGELYIGGTGLARGYLNDPKMTANCFISDPFNPDKSARLYRTGDRCRWLADGSLEFLGRLDRQVKRNGRRIELGEIESVLAAHPAVGESAVVVQGEEDRQRLVAYVSARAGAGVPLPPALRRYLRERLPEYMTPTDFVLLPALPHTPSGKVDYGTLPPPSAKRAEDRPLVAPRTPLEEYLAGLWKELLGVSSLGVHDNFFDLGGTSIQGAMLLQRVQEKLGRQIYTVALFDAPTVAGLADYLRDLCPDVIHTTFGEGQPTSESRRAAAPSTNLLVPLQPKGTRPGCFFVHPPGGIVVCYQALAQHLGEDRPVYGIRSRGLHGETDLPATLEAMASEYVAEVRAAQPQGPYHLGGWSMGGLIAYEMAQQLRAQGQSVGMLALLDTTIPWNEANAPFAEDAAQSAREYGFDVTLEELGRLGPDEQLPYLWNHVRKLGLIDDDTPLSLAQQILDDLKRLFHTHIQLGSAYALRPYPGRLTLFRPTDSPVPISVSADRNWSKLASEVEVHFVPGLHHTMVKQPHVRDLARLLHQSLSASESPPPLRLDTR